jgi:tetratricopeptide (TPR) repeat protein
MPQFPERAADEHPAGGGDAFGAEPFGQVLRRLRNSRGLSLGKLADAVHYSKGQVSKIENGAAAPSPQFAHLCDVALDSGGVLLEIVNRMAGRERGRPAANLPGIAALPRNTSHFVGRRRELGALLAFLTGRPAPGAQSGSSRMYVLHGMPGVGKTALVVQAAYLARAAFPDGCLFVDLHGFTPSLRPVAPASVLDRFLRRLGVPGPAIPEDPDERAALFRERVTGRRLLLVLDNAANAGQVEPLLPADPRCAVVVTSRRRLTALDDAEHLRLEVLAAGEAAELFRSVARTRFAGPEAAGAIDRIVRRCGHLPLAVRIVAAGLRHQPHRSLTELDRRLADDATYLHELDDGERTAVVAFHASLDSLDARERTMLLRVARHPGADFAAAAAAALAGTDVAAAARSLDRLLEANLLAPQGAGRYRLHDLVRAYMIQVAAAQQDREDDCDALRRLLDHYVAIVELCDSLIAPHRYHPGGPAANDPWAPRTWDDAVAWMAAEQSNLIAACEAAAQHGLRRHCWQLAYNLRGYFFLTKDWQSWIETHRLALAAAGEDGDRRWQGYLLNGLGQAHSERGDVEAAASCHEQALQLFTELADQRGVSNTLGNYAWVHHSRGQHRRALRMLEQALAYYTETADRHNIAITLRGIGVMETGLRSYRAAIEHLRQACAAFVELRLPLDETMAANGLGEAHLGRGDRSAAFAAYEHAARLAEECGSRYEQARALHGMALTTEDGPLRRHHLGAALDLYSALGAPEADQVRADLTRQRHEGA